MTIRESRKWLWPFAAALAVAAVPAAVRLVGFLNPPASPPRPLVDAQSVAVATTSTVADAGGKSGLVLDDRERETIWEIEHHGLVLSRHGLGPLADALGRGDQDALRNLLAVGFTGLISNDREVRLDAAFAHVLRQQDPLTLP